MVSLWITIGLVVVAVILVAWIISLYNSFVRAENRIDNAWAQIDVQLQRRGELIPNLVETVKGYASHERETLDSVTQARAALLSAGNRQEAMAAEGFLEQALGKLFAVAEAYPDLKANTNFLQLQDELAHTENKVAAARQFYNDAVLAFNNAIEVFPANLIANMVGKGEEKPMLEVPEATKAVPQVSF
ncbi:MAG: LemA family protein [Thermoplasmatota archaeon]